MAITNCLAGVAVSDLEQATKWYSKIFGRGPDSQPMGIVNEWSFEDGGWVQIFEDDERAGKSSVTFVVSDLTGELQRLAALEIDCGDRNSSEIVDTAILSDSYGNQIVLAEPSDPNIAQ